MKVIGGSFGADGKAEIDNSGVLINGTVVGRQNIQAMSAVQNRDREFSLFALLSGIFLLIPLCSLIVGYFFGQTAGFLAGLAAFIFTLFACFDRVDRRIVTINKIDNKTAIIQCEKKQAEKLMALAPH